MEIDMGASITVTEEQYSKQIYRTVQPKQVIWNWKPLQVK